MAISPLMKETDAWGKHYVRIYDFTLDNSYPAGGYAIDPTRVGLSYIWGMIPLGGNAASAGLRPVWDNVNKKLVISGGPNSEFSYVPGGGDILGGASTNAENADAAASATNAAYIAALATFTAIGEGGTLILAKQPDISRNLVIEIKNDSGGALNLFQGVTTFAVVGKFRGIAQTENITFTSTAGNKSVADTKFRRKYGVKPFDSITSITVTNIGDGGLKVSAGIGVLIGLPLNPATGTDADMIKATKNAADLAVAGLTSFANNTFNFGATLADGDDVALLYMVSGQVVTGQDLSASVVRMLVVGV